MSQIKAFRDNPLLLLVFLAIIGLSLILLIRGGEYVSFLKKRAKYQAVHDCFEVAQIDSSYVEQASQKQVHITEPVREIYAYCMKDKGFFVNELQ